VTRDIDMEFLSVPQSVRPMPVLWRKYLLSHERFTSPGVSGDSGCGNVDMDKNEGDTLDRSWDKRKRC